MHDERLHQAHGRMVPYSVELEKRSGDVFIHVPESRSRGPSVFVAGVLIIALAGGAGYGFGTWRTQGGEGATAQAPAKTEAETAPVAAPSAEHGSALAAEVPEPPRPAAAPLVPAYLPAQDLSPYVTQDTGLVETSVYGSATIIPPVTPPYYIPALPPPSGVLAKLLYGQHLVAKTLVANYGWIVEPGEIIELQVDQVWADPAESSQGVYVTFVAIAEGKGVRASGLLRYDGDGSPGNAYVARDFMPSSVVRVGSW